MVVERADPKRHRWRYSSHTEQCSECGLYNQRGGMSSGDFRLIHGSQPLLFLFLD